MFSLFIPNKGVNAESKFYAIHEKYEKYKIQLASCNLIVVSWGSSAAPQVSTFGSLTVLLEGYCFYATKLLDVSEIFRLFSSGDLDKLRALNGSFNIVIFNALNNELTLFTDKFATRALFYSDTDSGFMLSGRLSAITHSTTDVITFDPNSVSEYIYFGFFIQNGKTLFKNIFLTKSATELTYRESILTKQYWLPKANYRVPKHTRKKEFELFYEGFQTVWNETFDRCDLVTGDSNSVLVPLSAGYDSRSILSELAIRNTQRLSAFTISTSPSYEADTAALVAKALDVDHIALTISSENFFNDYEIDRGVMLSDGMIFGTPYIPNSLYRSMRNKGNFVYSGFSGDPIMGSHTIPPSHDQSISLGDYCFKKYSDYLSFENSSLDDLVDQNALRSSIIESVEPFSDMPLTVGFDSWYMVNRNRYTTQMGVLANRDEFDYILPFADAELYDFTSSMNLEGRLERRYFIKAMERMYPESFSVRSSVSPPAFYKAKYFAIRALNRFRVTSCTYDMQYKLDFSNLLNSDDAFSKYCFNAVENLEVRGVIPRYAGKKVVQDHLDGRRHYGLIDRLVSLHEICENYL